MLASCRLSCILVDKNISPLLMEINEKRDDICRNTLLHVLGDVFGENAKFEGS